MMNDVTPLVQVPGIANTAIVPDILLSLTKDHRYIKQLTFLFSQALYPYLPTTIRRNTDTNRNRHVHVHGGNTTTTRTSDNSTFTFSLDAIQPEVSLLSRLFHAYVIFNSNRSIGQEYLFLYLNYRNITNENSNENGAKKKVRVVDIRKCMFVFLYTVSPYLIQRAGRGGWDELKTLLYQCWNSARRRGTLINVVVGQGEEEFQLGRRGQDQDFGSSNNQQRQSQSLQRDRLRGTERRQAYEEMRRRMIQRSVEEEKRENEQEKQEEHEEEMKGRIGMEAKEGEDKMEEEDDDDDNNDYGGEHDDELVREQIGDAYLQSESTKPYYSLRVLIIALQRKLRPIIWAFLRQIHEAMNQLPTNNEPYIQSNNNHDDGNDSQNYDSSNNSITNNYAYDKYVIPTLKWIMRLNIALFYINGKYPNILHRLTATRIQNCTPSTRAGSNINSARKNMNYRDYMISAERPSYQPIGLLILVQCTAQLVKGMTNSCLDAWDAYKSNNRQLQIQNEQREIHIQQHQQRQRQQQHGRCLEGGEVREEERQCVTSTMETRVPSMLSPRRASADNNNIVNIASPPRIISSDSNNRSTKLVQCGICMNDRVNPSAPKNCGHVFCWGCVQHWIATVRPECPLCRAPTRAQDVIVLYKYFPNKS